MQVTTKSPQLRHKARAVEILLPLLDHLLPHSVAEGLHRQGGESLGLKRRINRTYFSFGRPLICSFGWPYPKKLSSWSSSVGPSGALSLDRIIHGQAPRFIHG
jgi:hypothetical protein